MQSLLASFTHIGLAIDIIGFLLVAYGGYYELKVANRLIGEAGSGTLWGSISDTDEFRASVTLTVKLNQALTIGVFLVVLGFMLQFVGAFFD